MADKVLIDFAADFDMRRVVVRGGAKVSPAQEKDRSALHVVTASSAEAPEIEFAAGSEGRWDVSAHTHVKVALKNSGTRPLLAHCRVENPGATAKGLDCVFDIAAALPGNSGIAPGESGSILVELCRKKPDWVKVNLHGMIGRPWSDSPSDKTSERAIDPAQVVKLVIYGLEPAGGQQFEILGIRAIGHQLPPTPLLADPQKFFPFIDEFGQYIHADWPGKVHSLDELGQARDREAKDLAAHGPPAGWDRFGGWKDGPSLKATGWFRVEKYQGKWWLIDPDGKLFFSHGMDCVNWREGLTQTEERENYFRSLPSQNDGPLHACYHRMTQPVHMGHFKGKTPLCFSFGEANLQRKYGPQWKEAYADICHRRLESWGLNTIGNWSEPAIYTQSKTPHTINVRIGGKLLEGSSGYWGKFRDVFDDEFRSEVRSAVAAQTPAGAKDPRCLGYFVDNEISWGTDDISLAAAALASPAGQVAKDVFLHDLQAKYGRIDQLNAAWGTAHSSWDALLKCTTPPDAVKAHGDLAAFHEKTADTYFRIIRDAMKQAVPHQLYLGCRFAWFNAPAVAAACRHCDVVSFNIYQRSVANFRMPADADMPLMIGEFHFGALDRGMFHPGLAPLPDQTLRALAYKEYVQGMLRHPQFVGGHWFKYMDEPTTGRPSDEENYQVGFLSIADTPYAETIQAARDVAASMYEYRAKMV